MWTVRRNHDSVEKLTAPRSGNCVSNCRFAQEMTGIFARYPLGTAARRNHRDTAGRLRRRSATPSPFWSTYRFMASPVVLTRSRYHSLA